MPVHLDTDVPPFALADLPTSTIEAMTGAALGQSFTLDRCVVDPIGYLWGSPATAGLWKVRVTGTASGAPASFQYFVKLVRHLRLWPMLHTIPEPIREIFVNRPMWKFELDMYESGIGEVLPPGMRTPFLHHAERHGDDYAALWWEFVDIDPQPWAVADFARTAFLLGRLAARRAEGNPVNSALPGVCRALGRTTALRLFVQFRVMGVDVPRLRAPESWASDEVLAAVAQTGDRNLCDDLLAFANRLPALLDLLDTLPLTYGHGVASPQNLLIPRGDRKTRVVIDWGMETLLPIGFDLGQLLIGLAHADILGVDELPAIADAIVPAYLEGLRAEGFSVPDDVVRTGFIGSITCRSALSAIPFPGPGVPPVSHRTMVNRLRLSRYLLDLAKFLQPTSTTE
jgi:hypothetical protein